MKKLLMSGCIVALVAMANTSNAQKTHAGIKGGFSLTDVSNLKGKERTTGHAGIFVQQTINSKWCIQPELLYAAQGQHFTNDIGERKMLALDYIQLPIMIQYFPVKKLYVEFGPQVGVLVNSDIKNADNGENKIDVKENYRKADVGVNAGLGVNITKNLGVYGRYSLGLVDVAKNESVYRRNGGIQLGAAIRF